MAAELEQVLHEEADIQSEIDDISGREDKKYTPWLWMSLVLLLAAAAGIAAFYTARAGVAAMYGSAGAAILAILFYVLHSHVIHKKEIPWKTGCPERRTGSIPQTDQRKISRSGAENSG